MSQPITTDAFWMVWSPGGATPPRVRHPSEFQAQQAAEAMARRHPGQEFFVVHATTTYLMPADGLASARLRADNDIPF